MSSGRTTRTVRRSGAGSGGLGGAGGLDRAGGAGGGGAVAGGVTTTGDAGATGGGASGSGGSGFGSEARELVPNMPMIVCWAHCWIVWPRLRLDDLIALRQVLHGAVEDRRERLEHALPAHGHGGDRVDVAGVERAVHELDGRQLGEVALVVLEHQRHRRRIQLVCEEVLRHLPEALDVLLPPVGGRVRDEDQGIGPLQDEAARGGVHGLPGDGEDLELEVEAAKARRLQGQQVEQDGPILGRVDRDQLTPTRGQGVLVEDLEVGRLPPDGRAVVDDLDLDRPLAVVQLDHGPPRRRLAPIRPAAPNR